MCSCNLLHLTPVKVAGNARKCLFRPINAIYFQQASASTALRLQEHYPAGNYPLIGWIFMEETEFCGPFVPLFGEVIEEVVSCCSGHWRLLCDAVFQKKLFLYYLITSLVVWMYQQSGKYKNYISFIRKFVKMKRFIYFIY